MGRGSVNFTLPQMLAITFFLGRGIGIVIFFLDWWKAQSSIAGLVLDRASFYYLHARHSLWTHASSCAVKGGLTAPVRLGHAMVDKICELGDAHDVGTRSQDSFGGGCSPTSHTIMVASHVELHYHIVHGLLVIAAGGWLKISMLGYLHNSLRGLQWYNLALSAVLSMYSMVLSVREQFYSIHVLQKHLQTWPVGSHPEKRLRRGRLILFSKCVLLVSAVALLSFPIRLFGVWWCPTHTLNISTGCVSKVTK